MRGRLIVAVEESKSEEVKRAIAAVVGDANVYVALIVEADEDKSAQALIAAMLAGASVVTKA